jgi:hypothetical protein
VVLRRLHQLLRRPAAAPRRPDRQRQYLKLLTKTINQVLQTPGARCSPWPRPADAWVKYYRQDENTPTPPSATTPRARWWPVPGPGPAPRRPGTLDDVMRGLWRAGGRPHGEADVLAVLQELTGRTGGRDRAVGARHRGAAAGRAAGRPRRQPAGRAAQLAQRLGLRVQRTAACRSRPCCAAAWPSRPA